MRLAHIGLKRIKVEDTSVKLEDVIVWQPFGWYAFIVLEGVTGPEFAELEDLIRNTSTFTGIMRNLDFVAHRQSYDYRNERTWIEMYDPEYTDEFIRRGALFNPQIMLELGRGFFAKLESQLQEYRNQQVD